MHVFMYDVALATWSTDQKPQSQTKTICILQKLNLNNYVIQLVFVVYYA